MPPLRRKFWSERDELVRVTLETVACEQALRGAVAARRKMSPPLPERPAGCRNWWNNFKQESIFRRLLTTSYPGFQRIFFSYRHWWFDKKKNPLEPRVTTSRIQKRLIILLGSVGRLSLFGWRFSLNSVSNHKIFHIAVGGGNNETEPAKNQTYTPGNTEFFQWIRL